LLPADIADGQKHGYQFVIDIDPPPLPEFRVNADPIIPPLSVGFFIDQTAILRYAVDGPADSSSTVFVDVESIPISQAQIDQLDQLEDHARAFVRSLDSYPGTGDALSATIALLASEDLESEVLSGIDANADGSVSLQEFLATDSLALAKTIKGTLGLPDDGTSVAGDALLEAMLSDYQAQLAASVQPEQEFVSPAVPFGSGLPGDPSAFLLSAISEALPALGLLGSTLLISSISLTLAIRHRRSNRAS
jgi:hypothetical protein